MEGQGPSRACTRRARTLRRARRELAYVTAESEHGPQDKSMSRA